MRRSSVQIRWVALVISPGPYGLGFFIEKQYLDLAMPFERSPSTNNSTALTRAWRALSHPIWPVVLTVLILLFLLAHLLLPQVPTAMAGDAVAVDSWSTVTAGGMPFGELLHASSLFDLAGNRMLRFLLALSTAILVIRLSNRLWLAWCTRHLQAPSQTLPLTDVYEMIQPSTNPPQPGQPNHAAFFHRTSSQPSPADEDLGLWLGDRNQRLTWLTMLIEIGILLIVLTLLLNLQYGWQMADIDLSPGQTVSLSPLSDDTLSLDDSATMVSLCCENQISILAGSGGGNTGLIRLLEQQVGPALIARATMDGEELPLQAIEQRGDLTTELIIRFPQERSERAIAIPNHNLLLRIVNAGPQSYRIQVLDASNAILLSDDILGDSNLSIDDLELSFRPTQSVTLSISARPYLWLLIPALFLLLVGLILRWRFPYVRLGVLNDSTGIAIRWQGQKGARPAPAELIADIEQEKADNMIGAMPQTEGL